MRKRILILLFLFAFLAGCASMKAKENKPPIPLQDVNLEAVLEENSGLEMAPGDIRDVRDYYRAGVQQKGKAETAFQKNQYPEAMMSYQQSTQSLATLLNYIDTDSAKYNLFDESNILFFPNLLMADNHLKMGKILQQMSRNWQARHHWKMGLSSANDSLESEPTEWGLDIQRRLKALLAGKGD